PGRDITERSRDGGWGGREPAEPSAVGAVVQAIIPQPLHPTLNGLSALGGYESSSASSASSTSSDSDSDTDSSSEISSSDDEDRVKLLAPQAIAGQAKEQTPVLQPKSRPLCRFFAKTGRCRSGNRCKYSHGDPNEGALNQSGSTVPKPKQPKMPPGKKANAFERPSMLGALLATPIHNTLSQLSQTIRFLVANDMLENVELRVGEAEEREREKTKIVSLGGGEREETRSLIILITKSPYSSTTSTRGEKPASTLPHLASVSPPSNLLPRPGSSTMSAATPHQTAAQTAAAWGAQAQASTGTSAPYRPLNVRDALTYLDQVKAKGVFSHFSSPGQPPPSHSPLALSRPIADRNPPPLTQIQFSDQPDVYNRFLDVMKEFKGQIIDTPGVIDRVSTLFRGHPSLIQGFNTFLPPGYRIECFGGEGDNQGLITVTTPSGTVSQVPGGLAAAMDKRDREAAREAAVAAEMALTNRRASPSRAPFPAGTTTTAPTVPAPVTQASHLPAINSGPPPFPNSQTHPPRAAPAVPGLPATTAPAVATSGTAVSSRPSGSTTAPPPGPLPIPSHSQHPLPPSGPSTPSAAQFLASGGLSGAPGSQAAGARGTAPLVEFNHAISFVNKIKNRFNNDPDTYKQFLEILQTYQRDTRDIAEVYAQVTKLFDNAPDLLDEFKAFLPENGSGGLGGLGFGSFMQAAAGAPPMGVPDKMAGPQKRGSKENKDTGVPQKKRRGAQTDPSKVVGAGRKTKPTHKADSPMDDDSSSALPINGISAPQTLASPEEVAFFDKVKKFIDDKVTYHEFLKLINLFVQDMIDVKVLLERAALFIGESGEVWSTFKKVVGSDESGSLPPNPTSAQGGYGFGGMIGVDNQVVENTPMLDRVKPDLSGPKVKSYGPSYRKLPRSEINLTCTGRDAMCWEVLNDEWVSHPTWAAEDAAPFMAHRKNIFEEALHKSEEERHEYDYHIEANLRTIALLEPLNNKIQTMDPEERAHFNLKAGLGGQSKSIYQRIIKKVYGKELGPGVIHALHDNPVVALPIVLERLKSKDEEWKKAQREWNRVWREQDAKNFYKSLDHQGVQFKANDKKTIAAKSLISEVEARKRESTNSRLAMLDPKAFASRSRTQFSFEIKDGEVLKDVLKIVISYLDRVNNITPTDKDRIERHLRDFVPTFFLIDKTEFDAEFGDPEHGTPEDQEGSEDSDGDVSMADDDEVASNATGKKTKKANVHGDSLRKKLLKQVGDRGKRDVTGTPGPDEENGGISLEGTPVTESNERGETPLPVPADPEAVAEAVEKDKAGADESEQTWVQIDTPEPSRQASELAEEGSKAKPTRKGNFFANNHFYVLVRLIQILYSRLLHCKEIAAELAAEHKQPINPIAIKLGLAEPESQYDGIQDGENPAAHYYTHLLSMAERLFEGEIDANTYEETLRLMFGTKAYTVFTLDRLVASIVKQTQTILGDLKSQELFALLERDRENEKTNTRHQIAYRMQAEGVLGDEENFYRIEYVPVIETVTIQLMSKEDLTVDDAETQEQKWKQYIESYILHHPTEGLPHRIEQPFLQRTLVDIPKDLSKESFDISSQMEIKIALSSYRMFFTPETEDYFHRKRSPAEVAESDAKEEADSEAAKKRLEAWLEEKAEVEPAVESTSTPAAVPVSA
ncbi:paired amphipathic helix protein Sin3a, partial [Tremellales sp. Uapishka_1]